MIPLFEDMRLALRQICQAMGLSGTAAAVVPLVVLGVALNVGALNAMSFLRTDGHACQERSELRNAASTELRVMRMMLVSTLGDIGDCICVKY